MMDLATHLDELTSPTCDERLVALAIRGAGDQAFCAGADIHLAQTLVNSSRKGGMMAAYMTDALNRIRDCGLISVCLINGPALGGGAEVSLLFISTICTRRPG